MTKVLGTLLLAIAGLLLLVFVGGWIELLVRHGLVDGVRIGFTLWPGNVVALGVLVLAIVFGTLAGKALDQRFR